MRKRYSIGFFIISMTAMLIVGGAYQISYDKAKERAREEELLAAQDAAVEETIPTRGDALKEDCYYLMEVNGYVAVYLSDKKTAYDYTDIQVTDLPYDLQNEIKNGKYIEDTATLYGFLENYSS